jgi:L-threonylcarbamoyladenylate synthase
MTELRPATSDAIDHAAGIIRAGRLVAFPTETVYGLGGDAASAEAVARIFEAKQRALNDPLIVHVESDRWSTVADAGRLTQAQRARVDVLARAFWPGPLTLVLPKRAHLPALLSAGLDSVAVRVPDHPIAQALIARSGCAIAAPSANRFGHVSPTTAAHVLSDLDGRIDLVLDGGPTRIGVESTVLSLLHEPPRVLRPGGVTLEMLMHAGVEAVAQRAATHIGGAQPAPGMLASHYAPRAAVEILADIDQLLARHAAHIQAGRRCGLLITSDQRKRCAGRHPQFVMGESIDDIARTLYAGMRALDDSGIDVILATRVQPDGLGLAVRDRLARASARRADG